MKSRKVPVTLKAQRKKLVEQVRAAQAAEVKTFAPETGTLGIPKGGEEKKSRVPKNIWQKLPPRTSGQKSLQSMRRERLSSPPRTRLLE